MAQIALSYSAAQVDAAIAKINSLVSIIEDNIVQLHDGSTAIYPITKSDAVYFSDNKTLTSFKEDLEGTIVGQTDLETLKNELLARLQGTSANQDGYKDPIFTKEFVGSAVISDLNTWLDNQFFAVKDGVYYRNEQSGAFTISKDVPQCLININFQGVKLYVFNAPRSFSSGEFEQIAFGVKPISEGGGITWGSDICRRKSTYDFSTKQATWSNWESLTLSSATEEYINAQLATKVDKVSGKGLSTNDYTTADKNLVATISNKVDKVSGKGLSTNDYTTAEKTKLAGIETGANKTIVDEQLSTSSTNPVQNKAVAASLNAKVNIILGKGLSTNDYTNAEKNLVATIPSKASEEYVDENILQLAKQRTSFITPCFSDCDSTHEAKCKSITLAGGELGFGFKSIFSVTIKIAESLSLLNQTSTYLHIKDLFGNSIGVSMNGVKQMQNLGKYATWFFDSAINTSGAPIVLSLHTTNVASSASDSNRVMIIAHVNQSEGMRGCGVTDESGTSHTNWTPALGINVVNISAIYPQIKELQKYRMAYATSELPDISTTGHKANIKEIRINQNVMGISLVNSVSIMVASDSAYSGALELRVYDINDNLIATSNNTVNLSQNLGKYVTWYFTPFQLNIDAVYRFSVWNSEVSQVMRIHVASGKNEGVTCYDQNNSPHTDYCPAFGINISAIFADDLHKSIKEVNLALGNAIVTKAEISYVDNKVSPKADKTYVDTQLGTKVDKVSGKGLSSNDFIDKYKFATQILAEILERKDETQNGVGDIVSNFCLGTLWKNESLLNVGAEIPLANHYTFRHKVDKIAGNNQEYIELGCNTYYVDYYTGGSNLKELFIRVPIDEHSYILLHCRQYGDGHGYRWIVKEKISGTDDVYDTTKIPYLFSPLKYTDDKVKELQSKITALETRIAALEAK